MTQLDNTKIVVILGAGRTGSSLLTRILILLGMSGSENYVRGVEHNPRGVFEDVEILDVHKNIFSFLGIHPYSPVPNDVLNTKGINLYIKKLKNIVSEKTSNPEGIWGFKDPRTASLMPLWLRVFNPLKLVPKYIVTVRDPSSVVISMNRQFNDSHYEAELVWLIRTCDALYYSGGNCFIIHYEDWFTKKVNSLAKGLIDFIGLEVSSVESYKDLSGVIEKPLNRSGYEKYDIKNPYVKKLYTELKKCCGVDFDHEPLMKIVIECRQALQSFSPLATFAEKKLNNNELKIANDRLKSDNSNLVIREKNLLVEQLERNIAVNDRVRQLNRLEKNNKILLSKLDRKTQRLERLELKVYSLSSSTAYRFGLVFVQAVTKPGKNTLLLPYNLLKVFLKAIFAKR